MKNRASLLAAMAAGFFCGHLRAATHTAESLSSTDVQAAMTAATEAGAIVVLPAGTATWTSGVTWTAPAGAQLIGAGTTAQGGGDVTDITENISTSAQMFTINVAATGTFRMSGITLRDSPTEIEKSNGVVLINGPGIIRIDHIHLVFSDRRNAKVIKLGSGIRGVLDSSILDFGETCAIYPFNGRNHPSNGDTQGNYEWTQPTGFGTNDFFFVEDCTITGTTSNETRVWDGFSAAKMVVRFNTLVNSCINETHDTGHSFDDRGTRASEAYGNSVTKVGENEPNRLAVMVGNGTNLAWGNTWDNVYKSIYYLKIGRNSVGNVNNLQVPTPTGWGYVASPVATGTVNVSGTTVTHVSGSNFSTSWPAGKIIYIVGMTTATSGASTPIASVGSTTSLTLSAGHTGADLTDVAYSVGSAWDGNTNAYGYPALDQPGRGAGDLLTGDFPSKVNSTTGTIAWPNQALEPIYWWNNFGARAPWGADPVIENQAGEDLIQANRDYYAPASGIQTNATTPFDGTSGTGWGTLANRPTTCTTGVAYWATDQGSWNTSTSNPYGVQQNGSDGVLYVATATNTWTQYYEPYTYPHPLRSQVAATPRHARPGAGATILRRR